MTRSWIHFARGRFVRQARVGLGELREEHLSRHGFQGPVAMISRTEGPNQVVRVEGDYRARAVDSADVCTSRLTVTGGRPISSRKGRPSTCTIRQQRGWRSSLRWHSGR